MSFPRLEVAKKRIFAKMFKIKHSFWYFVEKKQPKNRQIAPLPDLIYFVPSTQHLIG